MSINSRWRSSLICIGCDLILRQLLFIDLSYIYVSEEGDQIIESGVCWHNASNAFYFRLLIVVKGRDIDVVFGMLSKLPEGNCLLRFDRRLVLNLTQNVERFTIIDLVADTSIILALDLTVRAADDFYFACHLAPPAASARSSVFVRTTLF